MTWAGRGTVQFPDIHTVNNNLRLIAVEFPMGEVEVDRDCMEDINRGTEKPTDSDGSHNRAQRKDTR